MIPAATSETSIRLLKVYALYRLVLAALLLFIHLSGMVPLTDSSAFQTVSYMLEFWFGLALLNALSLVFKRLNRIYHEVVGLLLDVLLLSLLGFYAEGIKSGIFYLLLPTVASAGLCFPRRISLFIAAVGVVATLAAHGLLILNHNLSSDNSVPAAILGILIFLVTSVSLFLRTVLTRVELAAKENKNRAEHLSKLNQTVIGRMLTGIVTVNQKGRFLMMNPAAQQMLGVRRSKVENEFELKQFPHLMRAYTRWIQSPNQHIQPFTNNESGVNIQPAFSHISSSPDYMDLIFLEDTRMIMRQAQELKIQTLEKISAGLAHEIRNPLSAISQANQLLQGSPNLSPEDQKLADIVERHCERMNDIIETIFTMSRRLEPEFTPVQLRPWLEEFVKEYGESSTTPCQIDVAEVDPAMLIVIDTGHLKQILTNLFDNGLRYSERATGAGHVWLSTPHNPLPNALPILDIHDSGTGINPEILPHIFDPFFTTDAKGTGLGLYMSRELCEANFASLNYLCKNSKEPSSGFFRITFAHPNKVLH